MSLVVTNHCAISLDNVSSLFISSKSIMFGTQFREARFHVTHQTVGRLQSMLSSKMLVLQHSHLPRQILIHLAL